MVLRLLFLLTFTVFDVTSMPVIFSPYSNTFPLPSPAYINGGSMYGINTGFNSYGGLFDNNYGMGLGGLSGLGVNGLTGMNGLTGGLNGLTGLSGLYSNPLYSSLYGQYPYSSSYLYGSGLYG